MTYIEKLCYKSQALKKMRIAEELLKNTNSNTVFGLSIVTALNGKESISKVFKFIIESAEDNFAMVVSVIGEDALYEIITINNDQ